MWSKFRNNLNWVSSLSNELNVIFRLFSFIHQYFNINWAHSIISIELFFYYLYLAVLSEQFLLSFILFLLLLSLLFNFIFVIFAIL